MPRPKTRSRLTRGSIQQARAEEREIAAQAYQSKDINTGVEKLRPEDLLQRDAPSTVADAQVRARSWKRDNWFVELICFLREAFYNFELRIAPQSGKAGDRKKLNAYLEDEEKKASLQRYARDAWAEWIVQDTIVSFWREKAKTQPFLLLPEDCQYTDAMGIERLRVKLHYKKGELEKMEGQSGMDRKKAERYSSGNLILLSEDEDEYYKVLTRGYRGHGFGWPRMRTIFKVCSQNESMEIGESMVALAGRLVERAHSMGFEAKAANAMRQADYLWKKKRSEAILNFYKGHQGGLVDTTRQFDQITKLIWVDPNMYDSRKWATIIERMVWWGGPLGFMIIAKTPNPNLPLLLRTETLKQREIVGPHISAVMNRGFDLPCPIKLSWGNACFYDLRLFWDMVKFYTQQGPLSLKTGLEWIGMDPENEAERKGQEAKDDKSRWLPLFDSAHGKRPGEPEGAGRPPTVPPRK